MFKITTQSAEETIAFGRLMSEVIDRGTVVSLVGELGSGKTTLVKGYGEALGITRPIKSPTYTIVKEYLIEDSALTVYHIDAYRLEKGGAETIDLPHFITLDSVTFIEWAEFVQEYMPSSYIEVRFEALNEHEREITVSAEGDNAKYSRLIKQWEDLWKG